MGRRIDPAITKLAIKLQDMELATLLVKAGFTGPAMIRRANDSELSAIKGIGKASLAKIREKLPKRR